MKRLLKTFYWSDKGKLTILSFSTATFKVFLGQGKTMRDVNLKEIMDWP